MLSIVLVITFGVTQAFNPEWALSRSGPSESWSTPTAVCLLLSLIARTPIARISAHNNGSATILANADCCFMNISYACTKKL